MVGNRKLTFYEFFAGGGMARLGLGAGWRCLFANDICPKKAAAYQRNFSPATEFLLGDVGDVRASQLPGQADLAWGSFPCQDLSLAGDRRGLEGKRSGTFWPFWGLMEQLAKEGRPARMVVLENVVGAVTSNGGRDLHAILQAVSLAGYRVGPVVIDARSFVPQSRPRLFILGVHDSLPIPQGLLADGPVSLWHPRQIREAFPRLPESLRKAWAWWHIPAPPDRSETLADLIESKPGGVTWHTAKETHRILGMMSETNLQKVRQAQSSGKTEVGGVYKRMRPSGNGNNRVQRAEVRFDGLSGCLRTPAGGSSRQTIMVIDGESIRTRLLSPREAARLMGVPDTYQLPDAYNEAYHLMGDGLVVPAVAWLERWLLRPIALSRGAASAE